MFKRSDIVPFPDDSKELYDKIRVFKYGKIIQKVPFDKISSQSYVWDMNPPDKLDEIDEEFLKSKDNFEKRYVYGYHTYGGYWGFFRPDLKEVITYAQDILREADVAYLTTESCDINGNLADHINHCFNRGLDMHMGKTTIYYKKKS